MQAIEATALQELPIFPLPDVVLFPGALLPLHVFEARYREMTSDVLKARRLMGIARLRPGHEADYQGRPPVYGIAGVGYVVGADQLPDGRYHLLLRGVARITIEEELPARRAYREVHAKLLLDTRSARPEEMQSAHEQLVALCDRLAGALDEGGDELRQLVHAVVSPGACADLLSSALVRDADERQALLEALDPADRLERVTTHVMELLRQLSPPTAMN